MRLLIDLIGWPHELLHALALVLIGRRPLGLAARHIDIPADLTTPQYVFVAALPALVFWGAAATCLLALLTAGTLWGAVGALVGMILFTIAAAGTVGDLQLIARRLTGDA